MAPLGKCPRSPSDGEDAPDETGRPFRPLVPMSRASEEQPSVAAANEVENLDPPHEEMPTGPTKANAASDARSMEERLLEVERKLLDARTKAAALEGQEEALWTAAVAEGFAARGAVGLKFNRAP